MIHDYGVISSDIITQSKQAICIDKSSYTGGMSSVGQADALIA